MNNPKEIQIEEWREELRILKARVADTAGENRIAIQRRVAELESRLKEAM